MGYPATPRRYSIQNKTKTAKPTSTRRERDKEKDKGRNERKNGRRSDQQPTLQRRHARTSANHIEGQARSAACRDSRSVRRLRPNVRMHHRVPPVREEDDAGP